MMHSTLIGLLLVCAICSFCGKNFESLGTHQWRCKQKLHHVENVHNSTTSLGKMPVIISLGIAPPKRSGIKCCCGKVCRGARGLKMHQRSCRVILGLNDELRADLDEKTTIFVLMILVTTRNVIPMLGKTMKNFHFSKKV